MECQKEIDFLGLMNAIFKISGSWDGEYASWLWCFFFLVQFSSILPEVANAVGYAFALVVAFVLNKIFVFKSAIKSSDLLPRFFVAFSFSFFINQLVFIFFFRILNFPPEVSQLPAIVAYTMVFYVLNKCYVYALRR